MHTFSKISGREIARLPPLVAGLELIIYRAGNWLYAYRS